MNASLLRLLFTAVARSQPRDTRLVCERIVEDERRWIGFKNLRAALGNRRVEIAALRLFGDSPRKPELLKSAAMQQGLLQIYEDFCQRDASDCEQCLFPTQLAKW